MFDVITTYQKVNAFTDPREASHAGNLVTISHLQFEDRISVLRVSIYDGRNIALDLIEGFVLLYISI